MAHEVAGPYRLSEAADVLGVSDDTVRRWVDQGRVASTRTSGGQLAIAGDELARLAVNLSERAPSDTGRATSARNSLRGIVTAVTLDISKDNVFFGVRAVDRAGHRSPVAFPR